MAQWCSDRNEIPRIPQPPPPVPSSDLKCKTVVVAELSRFLTHFPCFSESTTGKEESCLFLDTHRFCLGQRRVRVSRFVVQLLSLVQPFVTPWTVARQTSLSFTISWSLLRLMSIKSVRPPNHLVLCTSVQRTCYIMLTSCYIMECSTPGFPVHHQLLELDQTHVH